MTDVKLDDIIAANPLDGTERVYVVQDITGTPHDRRATTQEIADLATGGGTPGGANGQVQYNDSGSFGGIGLILFADTTFYADPSGSTSNDGLTALTPWPLQYALDQMPSINANGYGVHLRLNDGTYGVGSGDVIMAILYRPYNAKYYNITGSGSANVILDGVDQSFDGVSFGYNPVTGAINNPYIDVFSGMTIKNNYDGIIQWCKTFVNRIDDVVLEDNVIHYAMYDNSEAYTGTIQFAGACGTVYSADNGSYLSVGSHSFASGATCTDYVYEIGPNANIDGGADYTNLTASGQQYKVSDFGTLETDGSAASIPGTGNTVGTYVYVN